MKNMRLLYSIPLKEGGIMTTSKARVNANRKYMEKAYEEIRCRARKEMQLNQHIEQAASIHSISKAQYILQAIISALAAAGIQIDTSATKAT